MFLLYSPFHEPAFIEGQSQLDDETVFRQHSADGRAHADILSCDAQHGMFLEQVKRESESGTYTIFTGPSPVGRLFR